MRGEVHQRVFEFGTDRNSLVGGQRPRCCRPDHEGNACGISSRETLGDVGSIRSCKLHVDGKRLLVFVFNFCFGQRGAAIQAPVHRLEAAHDVAAIDDLGEATQLFGLEGRLHRQVRLVPIGEHTKTLEVFTLLGDLLVGVFAALLAEGLGVELVADLAEFLFDLQFNRQAVAVPTRHERRLVAVEACGLHHHVLEDLVDGVADVDVTVGVGRAVDEVIRRQSGGCLLHLGVEALLLPARQHFRLALGEIGLHRERCFRQVQRAFVVFVFGHGGIRSKSFQISWQHQGLAAKFTSVNYAGFEAKKALASSPSLCICWRSASSESNLSSGRR